jgi:polyprenyl-phospho-N-acetylgalactosaminyl synthase
MGEVVDNSSVYVIVPAFNEAFSIGEVLANLLAFNYSIVVVDDGSTDATYDIAGQFPIHLLRHACNLGQGAAIQTGIQYSLGMKNVRIIVTFDADGQHNPFDIDKIIKPVAEGKCDVALGSRFLGGNLTNNMKLGKYLTLKLAIALTRLTTHLKVTDTHNGFRAFSTVAAQKLRITQNGMAHASQILKQISLNRMVYCEVPVIIKYSDISAKKGQSILNSFSILWDLWIGE